MLDNFLNDVRTKSYTWFENCINFNKQIRKVIIPINADDQS